MFLKTFLYFITDKAGNSYRVTGDTVSASSTPTPLPVTPDGWQEKSIKFGRSAKYHGLFRTFTTPLKFVKEGALILRDRLIRIGTEAELYLIIHRLDKSFGGGWIHKLFYKGEIDLTKAQSGEVDFTANIMEGDLSKLFKANENTIYTLDVDVPEAVTVKMDGLNIKSVTNYAILRSFAAQSLGQKQILPFQRVSTEGYFFNLVLQEKTGDLLDLANNTITGFTPATDGRYWFEANAPMSVMIDITGGVVANVPGGSGNAGQEWKIETSTGQNISLGTFAIPFTDVKKPFSLSATVTLAKGERVFFYRMSTAFNNSGFWSYSDDTVQKITLFDKYKPTYIKALRPNYIGQQLLNKITGGTDYTFESDILGTTWNNLLLTGFDAIRSLSAPKMKISFGQFFDAFNVPVNLSMSIKNKTLTVSPKAAAYNGGTVTALGEAKDLVVRASGDHQYNTLKIGFPDLRTTDVNGRDEFNTYLIFDSPVKKVNKELNITTSVFAAMYEIELTRVNTSGKSTTNTDVDNDNAFLHVETTPTVGDGVTEPALYYKLLRNAYDSITGILDPASAFNVELSPKRCLQRHGNYLRSIFYWNESGKLRFTSSPKNTELKTVVGGVTIEEKADVTIGDLADPLFVPLTATFTGRVPKDIIDVMETDPTRAFSFVWGGDTYRMYTVDIGIQPADNAEQEVAGLLLPDNDLTKLI